MKFECSNKFDLCYYGQVNLLRLKSSVDSNTFGGNIYFAGDGILALYNNHVKSSSDFKTKMQYSEHLGKKCLFLDFPSYS